MLYDPLYLFHEDGDTTEGGMKAFELPRTSAGNNTASYGAPDSPFRVTVSHAYGKRTRRVARLDVAKEAASVWNPSQNARYTMSCYIVIDEPVAGFSNAEIEKAVIALTNLLAKPNAGGNAAEVPLVSRDLKQIVAGES